MLWYDAGAGFELTYFGMVMVYSVACSLKEGGRGKARVIMRGCMG
jgi:hypothetical protein